MTRPPTLNPAPACSEVVHVNGKCARPDCREPAPPTVAPARPAREVAHVVEICNVPKWQCSGCRAVFFGARKNICPGCGREGYWSGSVDPKALAASGGVPHSTVCDRLTAAIEADRAERDRASRCPGVAAACEICGRGDGCVMPAQCSAGATANCKPSCGEYIDGVGVAFCTPACRAAKASLHPLALRGKGPSPAREGDK